VPNHQRGSKRRATDSHRESPIERLVRLRRNAIVFIALGFGFMVSACSLAVFPSALFTDADDELVVALFIFVGAYGLLICGGWNWAKAKGWNENIVLVGLLPVVALAMIALVPFLRVIVFADLVRYPVFLPGSMLLMAVIMTLTLALLPDRSGAPKRRHRVR
jgi:hypothetical protein